MPRRLSTSTSGTGKDALTLDVVSLSTARWDPEIYVRARFHDTLSVMADTREPQHARTCLQPRLVRVAALLASRINTGGTKA